MLQSIFFHGPRENKDCVYSARERYQQACLCLLFLHQLNSVNIAKKVMFAWSQLHYAVKIGFNPQLPIHFRFLQIPPMSDSAFKFYNNTVKISIHQCWEIEKETQPQSSSELWFKQRKLRLTASNFGNIIKRKKANVSKLVNHAIVYHL